MNAVRVQHSCVHYILVIDLLPQTIAYHCLYLLQYPNTRIQNRHFLWSSQRNHDHQSDAACFIGKPLHTSNIGYYYSPSKLAFGELNLKSYSDISYTFIQLMSCLILRYTSQFYIYALVTIFSRLLNCHTTILFLKVIKNLMVHPAFSHLNDRYFRWRHYVFKTCSNVCQGMKEVIF